MRALRGLAVSLANITLHGSRASQHIVCKARGYSIKDCQPFQILPAFAPIMADSFVINGRGLCIFLVGKRRMHGEIKPDYHGAKHRKARWHGRFFRGRQIFSLRGCL